MTRIIIICFIYVSYDFPMISHSTPFPTRENHKRAPGEACTKTEGQELGATYYSTFETLEHQRCLMFGRCKPPSTIAQ